MTAKEFVKILLAKERLSLKELAALASEKSGKNYTSAGICRKMSQGTLRFEEVELFLSALGYSLELKKISE